MIKKILLLAWVVSMLLLAACTNSITGNAEDPGTVKVEITTVQETLHPGRAVLIDALVTQGTKKVTDAQEVKFDIWKKDQGQHKTITAEHWRDGIYRIKTMFPDDGVYYVIAHVTAGDQQVTPQKELVVENIISG